MKTNKKTIFQQAVKTGDLVKIGMLVIFSVLCWLWVWYEYQKPFSFEFASLVNSLNSAATQESVR